MAVIIDGTTGVDTVAASAIGAGAITTTKIQDGAVTAAKLSVSFGPTLMTQQASTSGTSIDFTSIPSGTKRITVMFNAVSTSGAAPNNLLIQIGDSGGVEITGYDSVTGFVETGSQNASVETTGFPIYTANANRTFVGALILTLMNASTNTWVAQGNFGCSAAAYGIMTAGAKSLSATLDRVRITTVGGTDTFDAGAINVAYE